MSIAVTWLSIGTSYSSCRRIHRAARTGDVDAMGTGMGSAVGNEVNTDKSHKRRTHHTSVRHYGRSQGLSVVFFCAVAVRVFITELHIQKCIVFYVYQSVAIIY